MISTTRAQARRRSILLALSGWVALAATWLPAGSVVRPLVVAAFLASCPGAAMLGWWPDTDRLERAVLAVALSISAALAVTEAQTLLGLWGPRLSMAILALITAGAALAAPGRRRRRKPPSTQRSPSAP